MDISNIEATPKYRIGDTFQRIGTRGCSWWKVEEIVYDVIEPVYAPRSMPSGCRLDNLNGVSKSSGFPVACGYEMDIEELKNISMEVVGKITL